MLSGKAKLDSIRSPNIQSLNWICLTTWYAMGIKWDERRTQKSSAYCEILYVQMMKCDVSAVRKILLTKIEVSDELSKID